MMAAGAQVLRLAIGAIFRPKALLIAENLSLRQQLVVLQRRHLRPRLSDADRRFWILASRWFNDCRNPLLIVKPETVLGWQRAGWRANDDPHNRIGVTPARRWKGTGHHESFLSAGEFPEREAASAPYRGPPPIAGSTGTSRSPTPK
jgi:hypothetical protein